MSRKPFKIPTILTDHEVLNFLGVFNKRYISSHKNFLMCKLSLETGMRISEVIFLQVQDIDWNTGKTHIREAKGKKDRIIYINANLLSELRILVDRLETGIKGVLFPSRSGKCLDKNNINRMLKTYASKAGMKKHFTFHTFRHTYATKLYKNTGDIRIVQKVLGHSDISTTMIYTHIFDKDIAKAMLVKKIYC